MRSSTGHPRRTVPPVAAAVIALLAAIVPMTGSAQDPGGADPRSIMLLEQDLEERTGPAEDQFITTAGGLWLPCDTSLAAASPLMIVSLDGRGWLIGQAATAFADEAAASAAMASAREALTRDALAAGCTSPDDVLVYDVRSAYTAPVGVGDEIVSATGRAVIAGDSGPIDGPMSLHLVRDGAVVTVLMVRAADDSRIGDLPTVETEVLSSLGALIEAPRALPDARTTRDWAAASAHTANAAADLIETFAQAFDTDRASRTTRRAAQSLRSAVRDHLAWLEDHPLEPVSEAFEVQFDAIGDAVTDLSRCARPNRCNRVIDSAWLPALQAGDASNRLRDLASVEFHVAALPESEPTPTAAPTAAPTPSAAPTATAEPITTPATEPEATEPEAS